MTLVLMGIVVAACGSTLRSAGVPRERGAGVASVVVTGAEIATVPTRPGVTVKVLLGRPEDPSKGTLVMFPGGLGAGHFEEVNGQIEVSNNFLMRTFALWLARGFAFAAVDTPSDQPTGMTDQFRTSREHAADVRKILEFLEEWSRGPQFLVGTSRGTLSAAYLAIALGESRIRAVVLTAGMGVTTPGVMSLWDLPLDRITVPALLVHHHDDACSATPFAQAVLLRDELAGHTRARLIEVLGGDPPISTPCEALSAHGFLGKEAEVVEAITGWAAGEPVPDVIGP